MARQRKPAALRLVEGTYSAKKHGPLPDRHATLEPLGDAPPNWKAADAELWRELAELVPAGIACRSDRLTFEILVRLVAKVRKNPAALIPAVATQIRAAAGSFGMSPADRQRLAVPEPTVEDQYFPAPAKPPRGRKLF